MSDQPDMLGLPKNVLFRKKKGNLYSVYLYSETKVRNLVQRFFVEALDISTVRQAVYGDRFLVDFLFIEEVSEEGLEFLETYLGALYPFFTFTEVE